MVINLAKKLKLWIDIETTGLNPDFDDIHQIAVYYPEENLRLNLFVEYNKSKLNPDFPFNIPERDNRLSVVKAKMKFWDFCRMIKEKYSPEDPIQFAGKNPFFDIKFLSKQGWMPEKVFHYTPFDLDSVLTFMKDIEEIPEDQSLKLEKVASFFDITFNAHDALEDTMVTARIYEKIVHNYILIKA